MVFVCEFVRSFFRSFLARPGAGWEGEELTWSEFEAEGRYVGETVGCGIRKRYVVMVVAWEWSW